MNRLWLLIFFILLTVFLHFLVKTNKLRIARIKSDRMRKFEFDDVPFESDPSTTFSDMFREKSIR